MIVVRVYAFGVDCGEVNSGRNVVGWGTWCRGWAGLELCRCGGGGV